MERIRRIYVEKKEGFDVLAKHLLNDIKRNLFVKTLEDVRILNRYDVSNITDETFLKAKKIVFLEPNTDNVFDEEISLNDNERLFAVEYLPGQYDQRADSAIQCVQIIEGDKTPLIKVAKVIILKGSISDDEFEKIKNYCVNPVDSRLASLDKPNSLDLEIFSPEKIKVLEGFNGKNKDEMQAFKDEIGTAMTLDDLIFCQSYFKDVEKRDPFETEIRVIDTYWSDHCRHTTFLTTIENVSFDDGEYKEVFEDAYKNYLDERNFVYGNQDRKINLMDIAVLGMKTLKKKGLLDDLDDSLEINACSIEIDVDVDKVNQKWLLMFKNETHNHPTEIEPFGGAATCLGGAIRDPLSGRAYVYQAMRITGAGDPTVPVSDTLKGKLPQLKIVTESSRGYSSYGNQIGLATGYVNEIYDEGYVAKRMEVGTVVAAVKKVNVVREIPENDNIVILVGGRTGRDGCGGATGSSKEHTLSSIESCGAEVQKGNPPTERKLQRLFRNPFVSRMIKRCNDFGAGGVSVAIGELSESLEINLDNVLKKYDGLNGTELAISESQERMAVVIEKSDKEKFIEYAIKENLEAVVVADIKDDGRLKMTWNNDVIVDLGREFLDTNGATQKTDVTVMCPSKLDYFDFDMGDKSIKEMWLETLKDLNVCSQKGLIERFDSTIGAGTVLMPFGGKNQSTPTQAMVSKIPLTSGETNTVSVMSYGFDPKMSKWSPFHGAMYAVVDSLAKVVATGCDYKKARLSFQEYFEKLGDDPKIWGKPFSSLLGAFKAQMEMGIPAIGGKDSMSGTFMDLTVPPTLISFAVSTGDARKVISPEFKRAGNKIYFLPIERDELGVPEFTYLKRMYDQVTNIIQCGKCVSAYTVCGNGISEVVSKMSFGNGIGCNINVSPQLLFAPNYGSLVLEIDEIVDFEGLNVVLLGETISRAEIVVNGETLKIDELLGNYEETLENVFETKTSFEHKLDFDVPLFDCPKKEKNTLKIVKPKVFMPVFPGTNCEYDTTRAFENAGAFVSTQVISNLNSSVLDESIKNMVEEIKSSQIIMIPGGFSAGDEPDGSGKFIAAVFRNPYVKEAVMDLLKKKDGLMLGICNGFQALIKLGLVPYGEIRDIDENSPTLTYNTIGRHVSTFVKTQVVSNKSPWFYNVKPGDVHSVPVSHGEGRFVSNIEFIKEMSGNGQIATRYVDDLGEYSLDIKHNPNGSVCGIEGITSPCGKILGKMGHSERIGSSLHKNIYGEKDQKIFISGVEYFN